METASCLWRNATCPHVHLCTHPLRDIRGLAHTFVCTHTDTHSPSSRRISPPRFPVVHLSRRQDCKMTRLTVFLQSVSDRNISLAANWGPWTLRRLFASSCNPEFLYRKEICQGWVWFRGDTHLTGLRWKLLLDAEVIGVHLGLTSLVICWKQRPRFHIASLLLYFQQYDCCTRSS